MRNYNGRLTEKYKSQHRLAQAKYKNKLKEEIITLLGSKCANPFNLNHGDFINDKRLLQIDHVKGGGRKEIKRFKNHTLYLMFVLKQIKSGSKDYQLLCANCNWIKRIENNEKGNGGRPPMNPEDWKNGRKVTDICLWDENEKTDKATKERI